VHGRDFGKKGDYVKCIYVQPAIGRATNAQNVQDMATIGGVGASFRNNVYCCCRGGRSRSFGPWHSYTAAAVALKYAWVLMQKIDHGVWYCNSFTRGLSSQDRGVAAHVQNLRRHGAASAEAHFGAGVLLENRRRMDRGAGLVALVLDVLACEAA
jgi:hypothetical protein